MLLLKNSLLIKKNQRRFIKFFLNYKKDYIYKILLLNDKIIRLFNIR